MKLTFLGAAQQVTGSSYLVETEGYRILIDCGLYQEREFLERNWNPFPVPPESIDILFLTHVHVDHSGLLPKLVREGFTGPVVTTHPTKSLLPIVLLDAARIQEEDAAYKKKRHKRERRKGPYPEIPLYTVQDAERVLPLVESTAYRNPVPLDGHGTARLHDAGHILGSAMVELSIEEGGATKTLVFSGDIGQWNRPLMRDPSVFDRADVAVLESTYGDREHEDRKDVETMLAEVVNRSAARGGNVVIPTFAIERAQELLFHLSRLASQQRIPSLPAFLDSPMAVDITDVFIKFRDYLDHEIGEYIHEGHRPFAFPGLRMTRTPAESKSINSVKGPCIILAGSGMCTGGRVKHHLVQNIVRPESTILFVGYQARGTLGRIILDGSREVRILGQTYPVRAEVTRIDGFSAHAGRKDLLRWLDNFRDPPSRLFLTHGDKEVIQNLAAAVLKNNKEKALIPAYLETWEL